MCKTAHPGLASATLKQAGISDGATGKICQGRSESFPLGRRKKGPTYGCLGVFSLVWGRLERSPAAARRATRLEVERKPPSKLAYLRERPTRGESFLLPNDFETIAVAVHLQNVNVMGQSIQERSGETFRSEDLGPFGERQIAGHQRRRPFVALA